VTIASGHRVTQPLVVTRHFKARGARRPAPVLVVEGVVRRLAEGEVLVVGTAREARIRLADPHVSSRHASFTRVGAAVVVRDLGSTNGVWVEGRQVSEARLSGGQCVELGQTRVLVAESAALARHADAVRWAGMMAQDGRSLALLRELADVASSDAPVWLCGESGTGKEVAAQAIHDASARRSKPRVAINCAALPGTLADAELFGVVRGAFTGADRTRPGAFQRAHGGTLLLDEIGELTPEVQAKLLRVLETGEVVPVGGDGPIAVDVRIIAATWRDLEQEARDGRFRFDLLQRLWVLRVDLPPLRARPDDIGPLLEAFWGRRRGRCGPRRRSSRRCRRSLGLETCASWRTGLSGRGSRGARRRWPGRLSVRWVPRWTTPPPERAPRSRRAPTIGPKRHAAWVSAVRRSTVGSAAVAGPRGHRRHGGRRWWVDTPFRRSIMGRLTLRRATPRTTMDSVGLDH
jgi:hypothetical protein